MDKKEYYRYAYKTYSRHYASTLYDFFLYQCTKDVSDFGVPMHKAKSAETLPEAKTIVLKPEKDFTVADNYSLPRPKVAPNSDAPPRCDHGILLDRCCYRCNLESIHRFERKWR